MKKIEEEKIKNSKLYEKIMKYESNEEELIKIKIVKNISNI